MNNATLAEHLRLSIEACIREHIAQEVDIDRGIVEASREIVKAIGHPIIEVPSLADALALIERIDHILRVPAAEYVPAIGDVFSLIDEFRGHWPHKGIST